MCHCAVGMVFLSLLAVILAQCLTARSRLRHPISSGTTSRANDVAAPMACRLWRGTPVLVLQPGPDNVVSWPAMPLVLWATRYCNIYPPTGAV